MKVIKIQLVSNGVIVELPEIKKQDEKAEFIDKNISLFQDLKQAFTFIAESVKSDVPLDKQDLENIYVGMPIVSKSVKELISKLDSIICRGREFSWVASNLISNTATVVQVLANETQPTILERYRKGAEASFPKKDLKHWINRLKNETKNAPNEIVSYKGDLYVIYVKKSIALMLSKIVEGWSSFRIAAFLDEVLLEGIFLNVYYPELLERDPYGFTEDERLIIKKCLNEKYNNGENKLLNA